MKTHYTAFYTDPALGEPFEVVEAFRMIQTRHYLSIRARARMVCESLGTIAIPDPDAAALVAEWNRQAQGKIIYAVANENPLI